MIVEWEDAFALAASQHESPDSALAAYAPCVRRTVGYWVGRTDTATVIATDDDRTSNFPDACGGIFYVPTGNVRKVSKLCKTKLRLK